MRASTKHKFIFIANPKCGSQAIRDALGPYSNIQGRKPSPEANNHSIRMADPNARMTRIENHSAAQDVKDVFDARGRDWSEYFTFTTIRNPWAKTASIYNYGLRQPRSGWHQTAITATSMADFIKSPKFAMSARTIDYMTRDRDGTLLIEEIVRLEELGDRIPYLEERLGFPLDVPRKNVSPSYDAGEQFDEEAVELVREFFKSDIEVGKYEVEFRVGPPQHQVILPDPEPRTVFDPVRDAWRGLRRQFAAWMPGKEAPSNEAGLDHFNFNYVRNGPMSRLEDKPVLIYTMGRVSSGSCSIALMKAGFEKRYHVHIMDEGWRAYSGAASPATGMTKQQEDRYNFDRNVRKDIIDAGEECLIISLVREPLTRNMSAFFMNQVDKKGVDNKTTEGLRSRFIRNYPHFVPLEWYQREFNKTLDIDVFEKPFDPEQGYSVIEHGRFKILLLRTELTNEEKGQALSEFLNRPIEMEVSRKSDKYELKEETNELYRAFKKEVKFRKEFMDYLYDSQYAKHFMDQDEMERLRDRWQSAAAKPVEWRTSL